MIITALYKVEAVIELKFSFTLFRVSTTTAKYGGAIGECAFVQNNINL